MSYYVVDIKTAYETVSEARVLYGPFDTRDKAVDKLCAHYNKYFQDDEDVDFESGAIWMDEGDGSRTIIVAEGENDEA